MKKILLSALATAGLITVGLSVPASANAAGTVVPVAASNIGGDWHMADTRAPGVLTFGEVDGKSAAILETSNDDAKVQLFTDLYSGTKLSELTELTYDTYLIAPDSGVAIPALNMRVDLDGNGTVDTYLVYEPYQDLGNTAVLPGEWQTWDALRGGGAQWWGSHLQTGQPFGGEYAADNGGLFCGQPTPCTLSSLIATFPDAQILEDPKSSVNAGVTKPNPLHGSLGINQGSGNGGVTGAVSAMTVNGTTYDFRPDVILVSKDECKDGGWTASTLPVFKNQGECVSSLASAEKRS